MFKYDNELIYLMTINTHVNCASLMRFLCYEAELISLNDVAEEKNSAEI